MESKHLVVAVDGPSGSGKSSVSRAAASELGVGYLDTGAMYRAVTWWCLEEGVDLADQEAVAQATRDIPLEMGTDPGHPSVRVSGREIEDDIRTTRVSEVVSMVATNTLVRPLLQQLQRDLHRPDRDRDRGSRGRGARHHHRRRPGCRRAGPAHGQRGGTAAASFQGAARPRRGLRRGGHP